MLAGLQRYSDWWRLFPLGSITESYEGWRGTERMREFTGDFFYRGFETAKPIHGNLKIVFPWQNLWIDLDPDSAETELDARFEAFRAVVAFDGRFRKGPIRNRTA